MKPTGVLVCLSLVVAIVPGQCAAAQDQPRWGGPLRAAIIGEPPSLDLHWTTATLSQQISRRLSVTLWR